MKLKTMIGIVLSARAPSSERQKLATSTFHVRFKWASRAQCSAQCALHIMSQPLSAGLTAEFCTALRTVFNALYTVSTAHCAF